ncbi:MAG: ABC transporter, partial [Corynebacterium sp.]|nr:ABC transporter [Corynebacterium sp.]
MTGAYRRPGRLPTTLVGALLSATLLASCVNPEIDTSATLDDM